MHLDRYKTGSPGPYDTHLYNDTHYGSVAEVINQGILGFCGCGIPEATLLYLRDVLKHLDDCRTLVWEKRMAYEDWRAAGRKLFATEGAEYTMWYLLDQKGLSEHGGSVPGWLSPLGKEVLEDLTEMAARGDLTA